MVFIMGRRSFRSFYWTNTTFFCLFFNDFWKIVNKGVSIVEPLGYALVTTYFLMYLFDAAAHDNVTVDSLIKVLIQLVLVVALVKNLDAIINTFLTISDSIINKFSTKDSEGIQMSGMDIVNEWYNRNEDHSFTIFIQCFVIWVVNQIAVIAIDFAAITRALEIGWRSVLAPIGIANCFDGGASSKGIQYLKTLGACVLSGAGMYLVAALGFSLVSGFLAEPDEAALFLGAAAMLGTAGAAIGLGNKIRDIA